MASKPLKDFSEQEMLSTIQEQYEEQFEDWSFDELFERISWRGEELVLAGSEWVIKYVYDFGGEGQGDQYYYIFSVSDGETTRTVKVHGWYASHYGGEYEDWRETFPKLKTITVWE